MILSRILTGIVAGGVIVAGAVLWRLPGVRRARWIVATLAAYGAVAFAHAALSGVPLRTALDGQGLFRAVPYVLQGAFIGGLVVLPLGWIVSVVRAGIPRFREGSPRRNIYQIVALTTCVGLVLASVPHQRRELSSAASMSLPSQPPPAPMPAIDPVSLLTRANEIAASTVPSDWDVDVKAETLGGGVEAAFAFVRDAVRYEPYSGVLRGASGTYTARAGNAVDRALLLQRFLVKQDIPTRFAIGTLPGETCARLFARAFETVHPPRPGRVAGAKPTADENSLRRRILARATRDFDMVRPALGSQLRPVTKPAREEVLAWMNPHVWIQAQVGGRWVDLDPSFADAEPGHALTSADRTVSELPSELYQRLSIRIVAEHLSGGAAVTSTVLDVTRNTVDLVDKPIFVIHTKGRPNAFAGLGSALANTLGQDQPSTPALWIAGEFTFGTNVSVSSAEFIAEWLEFDLSWPDGRHETTRRSLVDRAGAAWRNTRPLNSSTLRRLDGDDEGPYGLQAIHNIWISAGPHNLADFAVSVQSVASEDLLRMTSEADDDSSREPTAFPESVWPFALQNFAWMIWTDHAVIPGLNDVPGVRLYPDGARIAVFTIRPAPGGQRTVMSDLRRDALCGIVVDASNSGVLAEKKLRFGLIQGALEQEALAGLVTASGGDGSAVVTTSSRASNHNLVVFVPGAANAVAHDRLHPESSARLADALSAGSTVVAPVAAVDDPDSWWEIAAGTGNTHAVGASGLHAGSGRLPPRPPPNPFRIVKGRGAQQNLFDGVKAFETEAARAERLAEAKRLAYESRNMALEQRAKLRIGNMQSPKAGSSATGYSLLSVIAAVIKEIVMTAVTIWAIEQLYSSVQEFIDTYGDK